MGVVGRNIGGLLFAIICVVLVNISFASEHDSGQGLFFILSLLFIPAIFIIWIIADVVRRLLYPDIVMTSGFWGILKAKVFWRIGPQVIASIIILMILTDCTVSYIESRPVGDASSLIAEVESIMDEMEPIAAAAFAGNLTPSLEAKYNQLENKLISVLEKLEKHENKLTVKEKNELRRIMEKYDSFE